MMPAYSSPSQQKTFYETNNCNVSTSWKGLVMVTPVMKSEMHIPSKYGNKKQRKTRDEDKILVKWMNIGWVVDETQLQPGERERGREDPTWESPLPFPHPPTKKYFEEPTWWSPFTLQALLTIGTITPEALHSQSPNPPTRNWQVVSSSVGHPHVFERVFILSISMGSQFSTD